MTKLRLIGDYTSGSHADALQVEQTRFLYAGLPAAIIINLVLAAILVGVLSAVITTAPLLSWLALMGTVLLVRGVLTVAWRRSTVVGVINAPRWLRRFRAAVIATGIVWGVGGALLFQPGDPFHQVFLAFVLAGLSAGAITTLAIDQVSTIGFLVPTLIPLIVRFGIEGHMASLAMGAMTVVFLVAIVASAARAGDSLRENFLLRIHAIEREQVLRQSESRLNQAQRSAQIGHWELDLLSNKLSWSVELYRIFEIDPATFEPSYEAFLDAIHPDDRDMVDRAYTDSITRHEPYDIVHRLRFADGRTKYVHERCETYFDAEGNAVESLGTAQDITQRMLAEEKLHESELKYRLLFEGSRDALMAAAPPSWQFTSANPATLNMFAAADEMEFTRLRPWDISPERQPDGRVSSEKAREMIEVALRTGANFFEWTHKRLDGRTFPTEVLLSRMETDGKVALHATVRDITERKRMEKEISERRNEMEALQKSQVAAQTAAAIAHDLNQPLLAVASYSKAALRLLDSDNPDMHTVREAISASEQQALRAGQSIRQLLDYLSMKEFSNESFDLNREIVAVLDSVRSERDFQFTSILHCDDRGVFVWANRTHAEKALLNLLYNAVEAMQQANVTEPAITVSVRALEDEGLAQVTVQDNGPGLNKDDCRRLFKPFFTTKAGGIGMGLAISRSLIEANGGQLWAEPRGGPGARFHLTLPLSTEGPREERHGPQRRMTGGEALRAGL